MEPVTPAVPPPPTPAVISVKDSLASARRVTSPPTRAITPSPIEARTSLSWMPRMSAKPTPALPAVRPIAPASSTNSLSSVATRESDWPDTAPSVALIEAASPIVAWVVSAMTSTMIEPPMPTVPVPAPPARAIDVSWSTGNGNPSGSRPTKVATSKSRAMSEEIALSEIAPPASIVVGDEALDAMRAMVSASTTLTTIAAPMPLPEIESAPAAAIDWSPIGLLAERASPPPAVIVTFSPTRALLSSRSTCTAIEPATLAWPLPPAADTAQATKSLRRPEGVFAVTVTPPPAVMVTPSPISPRSSRMTTLSAIAAPMFVLLSLSTVPVALAVAEVPFSARTPTAPPATRTSPVGISATVLMVIQLTVTAAPTPTPSPPWPPCELALPFAPDTWLLELLPLPGRLRPDLPLVAGVPLSWF